jgi:uridine kinase
MVGDVIQLKAHHYLPAQEIVESISASLQDKYVLSISGESGCGKSTLSIAIKDTLEDKGFKTFILHMDDYFYLPPASNHNNRLKDIRNVGEHEVNLKELQNHVDLFKSGELSITKPLVHYKENEIREETIDLSRINIIIIEGTYTATINVDKKVFMLRNYKDTLQARIERARDPLTPFVEQVLEIEHQIIQKYEDIADILIDKNYGVIIK